MRAAFLDARKRAFIALFLANHCNLDATCRAQNLTIHAVRKWMKQREFKEELARRQEILSSAANVTAAEVIGTLASQLRADIADVLPDIEIVKKARARGVSHLIKEVEHKIVTARDGTKTETIKVKMVDSTKAAIELCKLMGLEARDDETERARTAIRTAMALNSWSPEEAITRLTPHFPAVIRLREEFAGPAIEMERIAK